MTTVKHFLSTQADAPTLNGQAGTLRTVLKTALVDGRAPRIVHISKQGAGTSFTAGGAETAVHNLILRVGGLNAAAEIGRDRYRPVTPEGMILMNPDVVVIGGGISGAGRLLLDPARRVVRERALPIPARRVRIVRSALGPDAGAIGAASEAFKAVSR